MRPVCSSVAFTAALVVVGCGDTDGPTAPTAPMAAQQASQSGAPSVLPARFDAPPGAGSSLAPDAIDDFNAYDFEAAWDGSMLSLALIEDEMRSMREASKPHRHRRITVGTCPVEPHHALQACGAPIWEGTRRLADRLELPPIPLAECGGWIIVNADELSDDRYDGWRNAPCPAPDGESVAGSDGTGEWPDYSSGNGTPTITNPGNKRYMQGDEVAFPIVVSDPDGDAVTVTVADLPDGLTWSESSGMVSGMVSWSAGTSSYTVTVTAGDGVNAAVTETFTIVVTAAVAPSRLFDSTGPFVFIGLDSSNQVVRIWVPYLMLGGPSCPANGASVQLSTEVRVRGGASVGTYTTTVSWSRGNTRVPAVGDRTINTALDSRFGWRGGAAAPVANVWSANPSLDLVGSANDPDGLVTGSPRNKATTGGFPPYASRESGTISWRVTDTLSFDWRQTTPSPPASGYCVVSVADCQSGAGPGLCAG